MKLHATSQARAYNLYERYVSNYYRCSILSMLPVLLP